MVEILSVIGSILLVLVTAWVIGRLHISFVDSREVGRLTADWFKWRKSVYGVPAGALVAALAVSGPVLKELSLSARLSFVVLFVTSLAFGLLVIGLSYLEALWYKSEALPQNSRRRWLFNVFCLPVLYSSLYLYWLTLIPAWLLFIVALVKAQLGER